MCLSFLFSHDLVGSNCVAVLGLCGVFLCLLTEPQDQLALFCILIISGCQPNSALHALFGVLRCTLRIFLQNSECGVSLPLYFSLCFPPFLPVSLYVVTIVQLPSVLIQAHTRMLLIKVIRLDWADRVAGSVQHSK